MRKPQAVLLYITLSLLLVCATATIALAQAGELQPAATPLEKAVTGIGGEEALQNLAAFSIEATGMRWVQDEGWTPGGKADLIGPYTATVTYEIEGNNLRIEQTRVTLGQPRDLTEVVSGDVGYLDGVDGRFGTPSQSAMLSDRHASTVKQQWLLNPHLILASLLADPTMASDVGEVLYEGAVYHRLQVDGEIGPVTLYIHAGTGQLAKVTTTEETPLRGEVEVEVFYYDWQPIGESGIAFPAEVYIASDGEIVVKELRSAVTINPELSEDLFAIPAELEPVHDETLAERGITNHQYLQTFAHFGFIRDGIQTNVSAAEVAPGVYHITGGSHNSLIVEQADGLVVIDTPLGGYRSDLILEWATDTFPDKPITHAAITHHHEDHAAGLREFVAHGATAVVHESAAEFFAEIFAGSSSMMHNGMEASAADATIEVIPAGDLYTIEDEEQPVELYPIEQTHAEDMVIAYLPNAGIVFVTDIYTPNPAAESAGEGGQLVADAIAELGLDVSMIVGGHGGTISFEDFEGQLGN